MRPIDLRIHEIHGVFIYGIHGVFWLAFVLGDLGARRRSRHASQAPPNAGAVNDADRPPLEAPRAGLLVAVHMVAFALMYAGIGNAVFGQRMPLTPALQRVAGALVILAGGVLVGWARLAFASWRFRARLDAGHQLATGGPFRLVRHPIYAGLDLLALGSALWVPTVLTILAVPAMALGGELRARGEEPLLERAFGDSYRDYRRRTKRFIPGVY
jgi:protein-S-isoprenylcysteine O-methyltransferase Ste14